MPDSKTLRDYLPNEFFLEFMDTPAARHLDAPVLREHQERRWPGPQKHVYVWWELEGRAVAWNENPSRGWSFPVVRYPA